MLQTIRGILFLSLLLLLNCCGQYKQVSVGNHDFYNNPKVPSKIDRYDVYVHDGSSMYRLNTPTFEHDTLRGDLVSVPAGTVDAHPETRRELKAARKDMHVYLKKSIDEVKASGSSAVSTVNIDRNSVDRVDMFTTNEKHIFRNAGIFVLLLTAGVLIIIFTISALAAASGEAANNSDSGSDSNSGDSGGSDSGGSDSDSGCYVATMVYGSYDAPNVMVLRAFRDRFLARFAAGRKFIVWYYRNSPAFVARHQGKNWITTPIRLTLNVFVWMLRPFFGK